MLSYSPGAALRGIRMKTALSTTRVVMSARSRFRPMRTNE
jgi:hypothetical protein